MVSTGAEAGLRTIYQTHLQDRFKQALMARAQKNQSRARKQERLEAQATPAQKRLIERAAALRATSVTGSVTASVLQAARSAIKEFNALHLRDEARDVFIIAALHPPIPSQ